MKPALVLSHLSHPFLQCGKPVSLSASWGSALVLHGKNGSGKSTLLDLIYDDRQNNSISRDFVSQQMTYLPQQQNRDFFIPLRLNDLLSGDFNQKFSKGIDLDRPWNESSGGEKQRVLLALTCLSKFKVWLLDEPFNHLDVQAIDVCKATIRDHCTNGGLIVISSHDPWNEESSFIQFQELSA